MAENLPNLTPDERERLRELHEKIPSPPWSAKDWRVCSHVDDPAKFEYILDTASNNRNRNDRNRYIAAFVAEARNTLPRLLAASEELERVKAERDRWQMATGCVDPETIAIALSRIQQNLDCGPAEGIPDGVAKLKHELTALRARVAELEGLLVAVRTKINSCLVPATGTLTNAERTLCDTAEMLAKARALAAARRAAGGGEG